MNRTWLRLGGAVLGCGLFTLLCMWVGMRAAGPDIHGYNLGSVQLYVEPSWSGKAKVYVPVAGWEIEAPIFSAPYAFHAQPRHVSVTAVRRAAHGVKKTLKTTKHDLKIAAILTAVRSFLYALLAAVVAGGIIALLLRAFGYRWKQGLLAGAACLGFAVVLVGTSGLWLWQSLDIKAFRHAKITLGSGKVLTKDVARFRNDKRVSSVIQDLSRLILRGERARP